MFFYTNQHLFHHLIRPASCFSVALEGFFSGVGLVLRNAAANQFGELKPESCVNRVKTSRHHLVHESRERQVGLGPLLSCPVLKVTQQLTSDRTACPRPNFSIYLTLCHFALPLCISVLDTYFES